MRTETREVTITQTVYISDDGHEFTDEDACNDYEFKLLEKTFNCYDSKYNRSKPDECKFIDLPTVEDVARFKEYCDILDLIDDGIDKPGVYIYTQTDYCHDEWVNLEEIIFKIRGAVND